MSAERARLLRFQRLERLRAIAKQAAALDSAQAESTLAQLEALATRTSALAADYASRNEARAKIHDGAALQQLTRFAGGLQGISASTASDAARARGLADSKRAALAEAERRRAAVEERVERQVQAIRKDGAASTAGMRKPLGTGLE